MNLKKTTIIFCFLCVGITNSTQAQRLNFQDFVTFQFADANRPLKVTRAYEVEIDQTIFADWNEPLFSRQLGISRGLISRDEPLLQRIQFLESVTNHFLRAQELLIELKAAASRLEAAKLAKSGSATQASLRQSMLAASNRFATEASVGLIMVDAAKVQMDLPEDEALRAKVNQALLDDYKQVAKVLAEEIEKLNDELTKRLERGEPIKVFMEAWITGGGSERPLHLDGYDNLATGRPVPFSRFQLALPERTTRELESAQKLGELVENSDQLIGEAKAAIVAIQEELKVLSETLRVEVLEANLTRLVRNLRASGQDNLSPLLNQVNDLLDLIQTLVKAPPSGEAANAASVVSLINELITRIDGVLRSVRTLLKSLRRWQMSFITKLPICQM